MTPLDLRFKSLASRRKKSLSHKASRDLAWQSACSKAGHMLVIPPGWWYALACKVTWFKFHKPRTPKDFLDTARCQKPTNSLSNEALGGLILGESCGSPDAKS